MRHSTQLRAFEGYSGCGPIPAQVSTLLPIASDAAEVCARTVFASLWGDAIEAEISRRCEAAHNSGARSYDTSDLPNLSGVDLCEAAPHNLRPARILAYARDGIAQAVALAFLDVRGSRILSEWDDLGAEDFGHNVALILLGTGAGELPNDSRDFVPTADCDGRLYLDLSEVVEPPDVPTLDDLRALRKLDGSELTDEERAEVLRRLEPPYDSREDALHNVAELLGYSDGGCGTWVESLELPDEDGTRLHYVNTGETYQATLCDDGSRYFVASWGACVEQAEELRTFETGETRCAHCSEWGALLGGEPCESCGHSAD